MHDQFQCRIGSNKGTQIAQAYGEDQDRQMLLILLAYTYILLLASEEGGGPKEQH